MRVTVNGELKELPDAASVAGLLAQLGLAGTRVAVEVNRRLIRRAEHATTVLADADVIEVVTLVGGG